jgi:hypothetical protein
MKPHIHIHIHIQIYLYYNQVQARQVKHMVLSVSGAIGSDNKINGIYVVTMAHVTAAERGQAAGNHYVLLCY